MDETLKSFGEGPSGILPPTVDPNRSRQVRVEDPALAGTPDRLDLTAEPVGPFQRVAPIHP